MDSSSKSSKARKGIRKWMDKLSVSRSGSRSRSRSPSQSSQQPDPQTLLLVGEPTKEMRLVSGASLGILPTESPAGTAGVHPMSPANASGLDDMSIEVRSSAWVKKARGESVPNERETDPAIMSMATPAISVSRPPKKDQRARSGAWSALRASLGLLYDSASLFPPLSSAVGILLSCVDDLENTNKHREEYQELAMALSAMSDSLKEHITWISPSESMSKLALSLEKEAKAMQAMLNEKQVAGIPKASKNEEELLQIYRRVQLLFQQLQANVNLRTLHIVNEQSANSQLKSLNPVLQAAYDSDLSSEVSRRGCTGGTRLAVLAGLHNWLLDPSSPSIYWMNGMAGTGKTTIAYTFCEQAENRKQLAASFFCTRNSVDCRSTSRIMPTIAYQLARYSISYHSELYEILRENPDLGSKHLAKQFEQLLKVPMTKLKDAMPRDLVVVIDALDECESRNGVETILDLLFRSATQIPLKILITSRPEPDIYAKMRLHEQSRAVIHLHDIETSLVRADIELYLKEGLAFMSPSQAEIQQLSHRSGSLFIYAATLVRYILYGKRVANPRQRLQSVLSLVSQSTKTHAEIDALYTAILDSALQEAEMEDEEAEDVKTVLRTVLFAQEPIDVKTIAVLGGLDDPERVEYALQPLRSVIHQSEETGLVSTLHASFPDFLLNPRRSGVFFCDAVEYNQLLAQRCFLAMETGLRFNICGLESSFVPDDKVDNLQSRIKNNVSLTLAYVCQYWANHLGMAKKSGLLMKMLHDFLSYRLLFWMEVLNLRRAIYSGMNMLEKATIWVNVSGM